MTIDVEKTAGMIGILRKMSSGELAVTVFLVVSSVAAAFWVENRYAKLADTQLKITTQQAVLAQQQQDILALQGQILNVVNALPQDVRKEIVERSHAARALQLDQNKFVSPH